MTGRSEIKKPTWVTKNPEQVKKIELLREIDQLEKQYGICFYRLALVTNLQIDKRFVQSIYCIIRSTIYVFIHCFSFENNLKRNIKCGLVQLQILPFFCAKCFKRYFTISKLSVQIVKL